MGMREKLIKTLRGVIDFHDEQKEKWILGGKVGERPSIIESFVDILIANGVTIPVRCKDCKWAEYGKDYETYCNHWKSGLYANIKDDDFCSYGERKDNETV